MLSVIYNVILLMISEYSFRLIVLMIILKTNSNCHPEHSEGS